ncbi:MAG: zinc metallopeptidase [Clostridiaceae bacterium]|uniref:Zinc metallopeptidase n=1 Tax=Hominiventricola aquisgranensis TaxID=3133164 RepID=A0ABV1HZA0_9FIRM|nr:zinc metallopeptidase [Clostridiaceae bacterium]MDY4546296.1 zinc metallopeptidase [Candidatus Choladocola sp.]RGD95361.1 zinc metallopeptidase [Clostridiales bacterium AM23-16LB]RHO81082.1 peptidase [Clostridiaceae bacterium AF42-6]RHP48303.1 peptidase [Clostridiaceae bacterium AF31-3BH]RHQ21623.1 peptidase [Clostridiaceae bacterium AF29-16BH]RHR44232.1 peptidase [Clostridiaceae bacterium AF18-31LB]RHT82931.1 peptidase [Clostridiaceae bacterium AM27-36LB]RHW01490.1 peptidase [Clostridia
MPFFYYYDPTYILVLIGAVLSLWASATVKSTYNKYSRVYSYSGLTGAQAAAQILRQAGIYDVRIEHVSGNLTDHYDPKARVLRLSDSVYGSNSVAAIGVAAHECGHAIQDQEDYVPLRFRSAFVPVANLGTQVAFPILLLGVFLGSSHFLIQVGLLCFFFGVLFQLITLPVEFNASGRAVRILRETGMMSDDELSKTKKVLSAAAMTYVAAAAASILSMLRLIILFGGNRRRD